MSSLLYFLCVLIVIPLNLALRQFNHDWFNCVNPTTNLWPRIPWWYYPDISLSVLIKLLFFFKKTLITKPSLRVFAMCIWIQRNSILLYRKKHLRSLKDPSFKKNIFFIDFKLNFRFLPSNQSQPRHRPYKQSVLPWIIMLKWK